MTIYDVACCMSVRTGCSDITLGIAGPDSKNKSTNMSVQQWKYRIFMRGVTDDGRRHKLMRAAVKDIVKTWGVGS